jgi:hypothetical protein
VPDTRKKNFKILTMPLTVYHCYHNDWWERFSEIKKLIAHQCTKKIKFYTTNQKNIQFRKNIITIIGMKNDVNRKSLGPKSSRVWPHTPSPYLPVFPNADCRNDIRIQKRVVEGCTCVSQNLYKMRSSRRRRLRFVRTRTYSYTLRTCRRERPINPGASGLGQRIGQTNG